MSRVWRLAATVVLMSGGWTPPPIVLGSLATERALASPVERCSCVTSNPIPPGLSDEEKRAHLRENTRRQVRRLLADAFAIFSGEVIAGKPGSVTFKRDRLWKGDLPQEFSVASAPFFGPDGSVYFSSCDYSFKVGQKYLVFAQASNTATVEAMACTPTGELKYATEVAAMLDELAPKR
jgi:outer membrane protein assembly factor BamB